MLWTTESFVKTLLEGGELDVYKCTDKERCLVINEQKLKMEPIDSWTRKIKAALLSIQSKILSDAELDKNEMSLLETSHLPFYKIMNALTAYKKGSCPMDLPMQTPLSSFKTTIQKGESTAGINFFKNSRG